MLSSNQAWTRFLTPMIDIVLHVDGKTFPANKSVLSQHSGYFRTVLSHNTTSLVLPTVPADYFALLLASMTSSNTLMLEINETNVYQLLLYGQLLQMPAVVIQCKAYIANHAFIASAATTTTQSQQSGLFHYNLLSLFSNLFKNEISSFIESLLFYFLFFKKIILKIIS